MRPQNMGGAPEDPLCVHGNWEDGVCVCERGYETGFVDLTLYPQYCAKEAVVVIKNTSYDTENLVHLATMAMTVVFTTCSCIAMASLLFSLWNLQRIKRQTKESSQAVMMFEAQQFRRNADDDNLHAEIWNPPEQFLCVTGNVDDGTMEADLKKALQVKVLHQYKPQDKHELRLRPGDVITEVEKLDQGWCKGKLFGKTGFFPEAFVEIVPI